MAARLSPWTAGALLAVGGELTMSTLRRSSTADRPPPVTAGQCRGGEGLRTKLRHDYSDAAIAAAKINAQVINRKLAAGRFSCFEQLMTTYPLEAFNKRSPSCGIVF